MGLDPAHRTSKRCRFLHHPISQCHPEAAPSRAIARWGQRRIYATRPAPSTQILRHSRRWSRLRTAQNDKSQRGVERKRLRLTYTSRLLSGTHKNLHAL